MQNLLCALLNKLMPNLLIVLSLSTCKLLIIMLLLFCINSSPVLAGKTNPILVISNSNEEPYLKAVIGFKALFSGQANISFTELTLAEAQLLSEEEIERIKPELIYALGTATTKWAIQKTPSIPIVATLMVNDDLFRQANNITGVSLSYSLKTQFQWLKKFFPLKKSVAILFNPIENTATIKEAKEISQQTGFNMAAIPVESAKDLPFALDQIANNVELLFAIHDETVMTINTIKEVLLTSFRNKVPLIGLSDNWVKSGAFYALSWDYNDLGKQCAAQAQKLLSGSPVGAVLPEHPRKVTYSINAKIAEQMNMEVPEDLLNNAKIVFN